MRYQLLWIVALALAPVATQARTLSFEEAVALARERGAEVSLAQGRLEEARARQGFAARRLREDPVLEVGAGPRFGGAEGGSLDAEVAVSQDVEPPARREARAEAAAAVVERAEAELAGARCRAGRDAAATFARARAAGERLAVLQQSRQAADELLAVTERRYEEGEAAALELDRARTAAAAARAAARAAEGEQAAALAELRGLLGIGTGDPLELRGGPAFQEPDGLDPLLAGLDRRPDLRALAAELREAEAEILLGRSLARPALGVRGGYEREEGADVVMAGLSVSLPVRDRGRETIAAAEARAQSLRGALEAARQSAEAEVRSAAASLAARLAAVRELEGTALPAVEDGENLAVKSFEAGEIDLGELLLIRREALDARLAYLDRRLDAALARVELEAAAGVCP